MWPFQELADWIRGIETPTWLKNLLGEIQEIIISTLLQIGRSYLEQLKDKIIEAQNKFTDPEVKWEYVFEWGKKNIPNVKDLSLNLAIEIFVAVLKKNNFVRIV